MDESYHQLRHLSKQETIELIAHLTEKIDSLNRDLLRWNEVEKEQVILLGFAIDAKTRFKYKSETEIISLEREKIKTDIEKLQEIKSKANANLNEENFEDEENKMDITTSNSNDQETSSLEEIRKIYGRGHRFLSEKTLRKQQLDIIVKQVISQLKKIYGDQEDFSNYFVLTNQKPENFNLEDILLENLAKIELIINSLENSIKLNKANKIFFGHGKSLIWRELKDFISDRLKLPWDEFNREAVAGLTTTERLLEMLDNAGFAFLIMTAEDEHADATFHARENVIHEVGLFQGRLGHRKAIVLLENDCKEFSNISGLSQIRFPKSQISAIFEEIRKVLEREGVLIK